VSERSRYDGSHRIEADLRRHQRGTSQRVSTISAASEHSSCRGTCPPCGREESELCQTFVKLRLYSDI
jgi:hypothetical protein